MSLPQEALSYEQPASRDSQSCSPDLTSGVKRDCNAEGKHWGSPV